MGGLLVVEAAFVERSAPLCAPLQHISLQSYYIAHIEKSGFNAFGILDVSCSICSGSESYRNRIVI